MNPLVRLGELRDLCDKVGIGMIVLTCAALFWGCNRGSSTSTFAYYFHNGTVYIEETSEAGRYRVYWHNPNGTRMKHNRLYCYNGLSHLPAVYEELPLGQNPFRWKPSKVEVEARLKEFLKDYDSAIVRFPSFKSLLGEGETKEEAFQRIVERLAGLYCSYDDQENGYELPSNFWTSSK